MDISASSDSIKENVPNRYSLVVLAAKRAKQIREGSPVLINTQSTNWLTIALEEIAAGKVNYIDAPEVPDDEVPHNAANEAKLAAQARQAAAAQLLGENPTEDSEELNDEDDSSDEDTSELIHHTDTDNHGEELVTAAISEE
jgi:DNA-directed RNA polymerase subunit omega